MVEEFHNIDVTMLAPDFIGNPIGTLANPPCNFRFNGSAFRDVPHHFHVIVSGLSLVVGILVLISHTAIFHRSDDMSTPRSETRSLGRNCSASPVSPESPIRRRRLISGQPEYQERVPGAMATCFQRQHKTTRDWCE
jgi:hypothetical protein